MAWTCWLYYFSKFIEMLDTVSVSFAFKTGYLLYFTVDHQC